MSQAPIRVLLSGDALITRPYRPRADMALLELLKSADVRFTNLEMLLNDYQGTPMVEAGGLHLSASPSIGQDLMDSGFNLFANANNHSLDSGVDGLLHHIQAMKKLEMVYAGVGEGLGEAAEPAYLDTAAGRVAMISCASSFALGQRAGERRIDFGGRPGLNPQRFKTTYKLESKLYDQLTRMSDDLGVTEMNRWAVDMEFRRPLDDPDNQQRFLGGMLFDAPTFERAEQTEIVTEPNETDLKRNTDSVAHARRQSDLVIVSIHAHEPDIHHDKPAGFIKDFARACINAGADIVTGSGPHQMRGIEIYKGKPIFYSLGNLWFEFETVDRLPADSYEMHKLDAQAMNPADLYDNALLGFHKDVKYWESALPLCTFEDGKLTAIELHCMSLGYGEQRGRRGTPRASTFEDAERILGYVSDLSAEFDTKITITDGIGHVEL